MRYKFRLCALVFRKVEPDQNRERSNVSSALFIHPDTMTHSRAANKPLLSSPIEIWNAVSDPLVVYGVVSFPSPTRPQFVFRINTTRSNLFLHFNAFRVVKRSSQCFACQISHKSNKSRLCATHNPKIRRKICRPTPSPSGISS
jgi:hypothetical protein